MCRIRPLASKFVQYFFKRTLCLIEVSIELIGIYFHSFEIFIIQIGEMASVNQSLLLSSQIIFRMLKKANTWIILKH
jgi:hypothetical protein